MKTLKHHEWRAGDGSIQNERWCVVEMGHHREDHSLRIECMREGFFGSRAEAEDALQQTADRYPRSAHELAIVQLFIPVVALSTATIEFTEELTCPECGSTLSIAEYPGDPALCPTCPEDSDDAESPE